MSNPPLISIVVAVYNGARTLQQCIDSIARQAYPHKELIIMDGASSDATVSILERNAPYVKYWESQKDRGIAHAWNKSLEHVIGDWVIFLGADDYFQDECVLSDMADVLGRDTLSDVVSGKIMIDGGTSHGLIMGGVSDLRVLKRRMVIAHTATFQRRTFFEEVGKFDETFRIAADYELFLRKKSLTASFVDRGVCVMGGEGVSSRLISSTLLEFRAAQIKNSVGNRFMIEAWHTYYQLRHRFNLWRKS